MRSPLPLLALLVTACSQGGGEALVLRHAAAKLGVPASGLRVTSRSDLSTERSELYLVTRDGGEPLTVVVQGREVFDEQDPGAFERVSRAEDAVQRLSKLGSERVALWFAALGHGVCSGPTSDQAHFAHVHPIDGGVRLSYGFGARVCVIDLKDDGSLAGAHAEDNPAARVQAARMWTSNKPDGD